MTNIGLDSERISQATTDAEEGVAQRGTQLSLPRSVAVGSEVDQPLPPSGSEIPCSNHSILQSFFQFACNDLEDACVLMSFLPVPAHPQLEFPDCVVAPTAGSGNHLDMGRVATLVRECPVIVGACIIDDAEEFQAAGKILAKLRYFRRVPVFVALLPPNGRQPRDLISSIEYQQKELMNMGVADVIINPKMIPGSLRHAVNLLLKVYMRQVQCMKQVFDIEPNKLSQSEIDDCARHEQALLWTAVPRLLKKGMPHFPRVDRCIVESSMGPHRGGTNIYRLEGKYRCNKGQVFLARTPEDSLVVVKVILKSEVHCPFRIEEINRECAFLSTLTHPSIARGLEILHSTEKIHIIMECAGIRTLEQHCKAKPDCRLPEDEANEVVTQIADALAFMHQGDFAHRSVSLHHVVVRPRPGAYIHATLVDLRDSVLSQGDKLTNKVCGCLPCIAPEVALGEAYIPRFADSWSLGVVLLEIAGGLQSLYKSTRSAHFETQTTLSDCALAVIEFFQEPDCHAKALGVIGGVSSPQVLHHLEKLLVLTPEERMPMPNLVESLTKKAHLTQTN